MKLSAAALVGALSSPSVAVAADIPIPSDEFRAAVAGGEQQAFRSATARLAPLVVLSTEERRLGLFPTFPEVAPLDEPGRSVLSNCPEPRGALQIVSQTVFYRNAPNAAALATAHVNTILALNGCPMRGVVEMDLSFVGDGAAPRIVVDRYDLAAGRG